MLTVIIMITKSQHNYHGLGPANMNAGLIRPAVIESGNFGPVICVYTRFFEWSKLSVSKQIFYANCTPELNYHLYITSCYISVKRWPSDKVKENFEINLKMQCVTQHHLNSILGNCCTLLKFN